MQPAEERPNVALRRDPGGGSIVVLQFPYDPPARHDGRGWFVLHTRAGAIPEALRPGSIEQEDGTVLVPLTRSAADAIDELRSARLDGAAQRTLQSLLGGLEPVPPARLVLH